MAITSINQLTPELSVAAAPVTALASSAAPVASGPQNLTTPAAETPAPGSLGDKLQDALANPTNGTPLSFNERVHAGTNAAAEATPPAAKAAPGSWARQLIAGATHALSGIQDTLADSANAAKGAIPGEGSLAALGRIRAAQTQRQQEAQKFQTQEDKDRASIAHENVQTLTQQALLHKLGDEQNHEDIANGQAAIANFTTHLTENGLAAAPIIAKDVTEAQLQQAIQNQNLDPSYNHIWPSGSFQPFDPKTGKPMLDKDGQPMLQKTFTVLGNVPETILDDKMAKLISDNVTGVHFEAGQHLSGAQAGGLIQSAMNHQAVVRKIESDQEAADVTKMTLDQKKAQLQAVNNLGADFGRVLANADGDIEAATKFLTGQHMIKGVDPNTGKPAMVPDPASQQMAKDHPNAYKDIMDAFGGAVEYAKIVNTQTKEAEQVRHDRAKEAEDDQKAKDKAAKDSAYLGDQDATGQAFLNSLKPEESSVVNAIGTGHVVADRLGYLLSKSPNLVAAVTKAFPDFDTSKAAGYAAVVKDYTSGKTATTLTAGGTALKHLKRLYDVSGPAGFIPGTADYADRQKTIDQVASEVARFNAAGGEPGQGSIADIKNSLSTIIRPREGIKQLTRLLSDNLQTYENKWYEGAPSEAYHKPMPKIDQEAKDSASYILSDGKVAGTQKAPLKPVAVTGVPHEVIVGGKVAGYTTDGGKTMTTQAPAGARPVGTAVQ
jgi:hypothetical protein